MATLTLFAPTPMAEDDLLTGTVTGLSFNVLANDFGGNALRLWSVDDGTNSLADLLAQDTARTEATSTDKSANGAAIWITSDGTVGYDSSTLSDDFTASLQYLAAGEYAYDTFTYAIRLGNGVLSWATAEVQFAGLNDPVHITSGAQTGTVVEDDTPAVLGTIAFSDIDRSGRFLASKRMLTEGV